MIIDTTKIILPSGDAVIIDSEDYELLASQSWHVAKGGSGKKYCGRRTKNNEGIDTTHIYMHRYILGLCGKSNRHIQVDHINGDGLDNRRCNLRPCNASENIANTAGRSKVGFKGVSFDPSKTFNKYRARIRKDNILICLGWYPTAELAAAAYDGASKVIFGDFARFNFANNGR